MEIDIFKVVALVAAILTILNLLCTFGKFAYDILKKNSQSGHDPVTL
jgi:hypothetical protein